MKCVRELIWRTDAIACPVAGYVLHTLHAWSGEASEGMRASLLEWNRGVLTSSLVMAAGGGVFALWPVPPVR